MKSFPILSLQAAKTHEEALFAGSDAAEADAMERAGRAVARALEQDFAELRPFPENARVIVLAGKGHNGGDALIAARDLLSRHPKATVEVLAAFPEAHWRPLMAKAFRALVSLAPARVTTVRSPSGPYTVALDGLFGYQYRTPTPPNLLEKVALVNEVAAEMRVAVDLPSCWLEDGFRADFTYATGILKEPLLNEARGLAGRIRFLDIGLFGAGDETSGGGARVLSSSALQGLQGWRPAASDKRDYGHVGIVGGHCRYPGAVLMAVKAALKAGAGLVTAFVPESLVAAHAASAPEAMWVGWPETPAGGLSLEGLSLVREFGGRVTSWVVGPGCGRERETQVMLADLVRLLEKPVVLDADALQPEMVTAAVGPVLLTPHAGELQRLGGLQVLSKLNEGSVVVEKGPSTWIHGAAGRFLSPFGGPVLARGGSGDMLAGMAGARAAQRGVSLVQAACEAVVWHGRAADRLARERGQVAVSTTELLDWLPVVLRERDLYDS